MVGYLENKDISEVPISVIFFLRRILFSDQLYLLEEISFYNFYVNLTKKTGYTEK